eukprot:TRINITY_DN2788_c0_g1_i1.p1 TRINITY_DN2788_c0_g1~~TRINITY_DN2788_c0_g1_i1.p1  ORF type:complete len:518 (-),score=217.19 TRINITY_DN2788_c0_g1_i1:289-1842(-)
MAPKRTTESAVTAQCKAVAEALESATQLPEGVRKMLAKSVPSTLAILKAERHSFQQTFANMIGEALSGREAQMKQEVTDLEAKIAGADEEKRAKVEAQEAAKAKVEDMAKTAAEKKATRDANAQACKEAHIALKEAQKEQKSGDASLLEAAGKSERLAALKAQFDALKAGTATEEGAVKKFVGGFKVTGGEFSMDETMLKTLPGALSKEASARGTFDQLVLKSVEEELNKLLQGLQDELAHGDSAKKERADKVEAAAKTVEDKEAVDKTSKSDFEEAQRAEKEAAAAARVASALVNSYDKDLEKVKKALEAAKLSSEQFQTVANKAFNKLDSATKETPGRFLEDIEGVTCDAAIVNVCRKATEGDKRVEEDDAKKLYDLIAASGDITQVERWTLRYCLTEFSWSDAAHDYLFQVLGDLPKVNADEPAAKKRKTKGYYITLDGQKCDSGVVEECGKAVAGQGDGRVSVEDAKAVFQKIADGNKVTAIERWTLRYCLTEFQWTQAARDLVSAELRKLAA